MKSEFAVISDGLRMPRESVPARPVFGANKHRFIIHPPLSEKEVSDFEKVHRVTLPHEYRGFLLQVGNGGAGPAYGLFKLGEIDDGFDEKPWTENDGFVGTLSKSFPHADPWNDTSDMPIYDESRADDLKWEEEYERQYELWQGRYWNTEIVNGAIPICHVGCAVRQWLVVTGPEAGNVWDDFRTDHKGLRPLQQKEGGRVTFLLWYRSWLEQALQSLP
jgi:hypothetical protein